MFIMQTDQCTKSCCIFPDELKINTESSYINEIKKNHKNAPSNTNKNPNLRSKWCEKVLEKNIDGFICIPKATRAIWSFEVCCSLNSQSAFS